MAHEPEQREAVMRTVAQIDADLAHAHEGKAEAQVAIQFHNHAAAMAPGQQIVEHHMRGVTQGVRDSMRLGEQIAVLLDERGKANPRGGGVSPGPQDPPPLRAQGEGS